MLPLEMICSWNTNIYKVTEDNAVIFQSPTCYCWTIFVLSFHLPLKQASVVPSLNLACTDEAAFQFDVFGFSEIAWISNPVQPRSTCCVTAPLFTSEMNNVKRVWHRAEC